jgi:GMP synthase (glutamine-hydrolysing)
MKMALVICHARFLDLASFEEVLAAQGYRVTYLDAGYDELALNGLNPDVVITLGGPVSAFDSADYPWIEDEMRLLDTCMRAGLPILAICLGAQILAQALGARVFRGITEIGWAPITLTEAGRRSVLGTAGIDAAPVLHWHGDTFELPAGAQRLASTTACENQAYSIGLALAIQFHPEVGARHFERWLICNAGQIAGMADHSVASLRQQARHHADAATHQGQKWFTEWLTARPACA